MEKQKEIMVSISCVAYNHEKYIRKCLEGFLMQKTNFAFEVVVHDDASTDNTASIIREYQEKFPHLIKPIYQEENQYSKEISIFDRYILPHVKGKYVAICEGDDYWTDEYKLQKQFDVMEQHLEIDMCAHTVKQMNVRTDKVIAFISPRKKNGILSTEEVILGGGGFVGTNSLFFRTDIYNNIPSFFKEFNYDYALQIWGSLRGGMLFIAECMSVYNYLTDGSWSVRVAKKKEKKKAYYDSKRKMYDLLDADTYKKYHELIQLCILRDEIEQLANAHKFTKLLQVKYRPVYDMWPLSKKVKVFTKALFPRLARIYSKYR